MPLKGKIVNIEGGTFTCPVEGAMSMASCGRYDGERAFLVMAEFEKLGIQPDKVVLTIELDGYQFLEPKMQIVLMEARRKKQTPVNITLA